VKSLDNDIRVVFEVDEKILILLDSFKLPVGAVEQEVEIKLSIAGELNFDIFAYTMKCVDKDFDSDFFHVFEGLDLVRFLLHTDDKIVFLIVENRPSISDKRVFELFISLLFDGKVIHPLLCGFND
jgi:hypothetical protein